MLQCQVFAVSSTMSQLQQLEFFNVADTTNKTDRGGHQFQYGCFEDNVYLETHIKPLASCYLLNNIHYVPWQ